MATNGSSLIRPKFLALAVLVSILTAGFAVKAEGAVTQISGNVTYNASVTVAAGDVLRFNPAANTTVEIDGNLVIRGVLEMKPNPGVTHTLRFVGIDESKMVGGGMDVLESDPGLWVMGAGRLDLVGAQKAGWNRTGTDPTWAATDELVIAPTATGDYGETGFRSYVKGTPVTRVDPALPATEVMNLTRSVRIEGAPGARSHVTIISSSPQTIRYVALRYMGPRHIERDGTETSIAGRYPIHFHMSHDGSRGSMVQGNVVRDSGNRAYVAHMSNGVTFLDNVAYSVLGVAYWWDQDAVSASHDTVWQNNLAGRIFVGDEDEFTNAGYLLGEGDGNVATGNVAVGVLGSKNCAGFQWPSQGSGMWQFANNVAHNNKCHGIFVWQNSNPNHLITDFVGYRNGAFGVAHGAYKNSYVYSKVYLFENASGGIDLNAWSHDVRGSSSRQTWSCVTVVGSPVALFISVSLAKEPGVPSIFDHMVTVRTPQLTIVSSLAAARGQTVANRASFLNLQVPC